jgi:hypothetical protein
MLCLTAARLLEGQEWEYELKLGGYERPESKRALRFSFDRAIYCVKGPASSPSAAHQTTRK